MINGPAKLFGIKTKIQSKKWEKCRPKEKLRVQGKYEADQIK